MRFAIVTLALLAAACAAPTVVQPPGVTLTPADAATGLLTGGPLTMRVVTTRPVAEGMDPVVQMTLANQSGAELRLQQSNHTPNDLMAQAPGGALAQAMGLFGEESPTLYQATPPHEGAPFLCGPEGPAYLGVLEAPDGAVSIVGLKRGFEFETRPDGVTEALPFSPDGVCARLSLRRS